MVTPSECEKAAQNFLDQFFDMLHHLPSPYSTQAELARAAGVSNATPSDYKNLKKPNPEFRIVFQLAYALLGRSPLSLKEPLQEYVTIPQVEGRIAANPAGLIPGDAVESQVWLHRAQLCGRHDLVAVRLAHDADSMEPSLHPGDLVVIDRGDREITTRGVYAVRLPDLESCTIKRLQLIPDQNIVLLLSDNPKYEPLPMPCHEHLIIGRVVWSLTNWVK